MTHFFQWWLDDEKGGKHEWWKEIKDKLLVHDSTCQSLIHAWLPRKGGVSCPSDLFWCEGCFVSFFNEGSFGCPEWLCECCNRVRDSESKSAD